MKQGSGASRTASANLIGILGILGILVCYPLMYSCNFPFPRMGLQLVGGKGKSCKTENLCYGKKDWIRPPAEENRGSIISWNTTIIKIVSQMERCFRYRALPQDRTAIQAQDAE